MARKKEKELTSSAKLDKILALAEQIDEKVEQQNQALSELRQDFTQLKSEVKELESLVHQMNKKHRTKALIAGGVGGALAAVGFELLRMKLGG